jgi:biopolymer transport protein ExbB/TolQ
MLRIFAQMGPTGPLLVLLTLVILGLAIYRFLQVVQTGATKGPALQAGINTILFWGVFSSVLGLFGQFSGITKSLWALAELGVANPRLIYLGLYESFLSTLLGMIILLLASLIWLVLRTFYVRLPRVPEGEAS